MKMIINYTKELGYEAYGDGISKYENPFEPGSIQFDDWNYGWLDAESDFRSALSLTN